MMIKEYLKHYTDSFAFSGAITVMYKDEIIVDDYYGCASYEHERKNTKNTKFKLWSITKQFTAVAILKLAEAGQLSLEDQVKKYFLKADERMTVHQLLSHTSGIFNYSELPKSHEEFQRIDHKVDDLIELFTSKPPEFEPGTDWMYTNTGYYLLGKIVEQVSGQTFADYLKDRLLKPLEMDDTGMDDDKIIPNMASGYYLNDDTLIKCDYINMKLMFTSGGMYSTTHDLLKWHQGLRDGKILSQSALKKMNTIYKAGYGYGVFLNKHHGKTVIQHGGGCEGFLTELHRYEKEDLVIVILSNYGFTAVHKLARDIASLTFEEHVKMPSKPVRKENDVCFDDFLGEYEEEGFKVTLEKVDELYHVTLDDTTVLPAYPINENTLQHTWIDECYTFEKENGVCSIWGVEKTK